MQIAVGVTFQVNSYCCLSLDKCAGEDLAMTSLITTEKKESPHSSTLLAIHSYYAASEGGGVYDMFILYH